MRHARTDYNRFQDPVPEELGGIPKMEPVFLIRGQDRYAPETLMHYADCVESDPFHDAMLVHSVRQQALQMRAWQESHANQVKRPDMPVDTAVFPMANEHDREEPNDAIHTE